MVVGVGVGPREEVEALREGQVVHQVDEEEHLHPDDDLLDHAGQVAALAPDA